IVDQFLFFHLLLVFFRLFLGVDLLRQIGAVVKDIIRSWIFLPAIRFRFIRLQDISHFYS
ncbi:MAG: hypothetical protein II568_02015, partial [Erysipelotrichaceae bacterium]|nr:hypothetical protein [Erysipelotrichaceae bacterium]